MPSYTVEWEESNNNSLLSDTYCNGDSISFTLLDSRECNLSDNILIEIKNISKAFILFPNPSNDLLAFQLVADEKGITKVEIFDRKVSLIKIITFQEVKKGLNEVIERNLCKNI